MQTKATRGVSGNHLLVKSFTPVGGTPIEVGTVTVWVGPNNSGKSESLRDLLRLAANIEISGEALASGEEAETRLIHDLHFVPKLTIERMALGLTSLTDQRGEGRMLQGVGPDLKTPHQHTLASDIKNVLYRPILTARSVRMTSLGELMPLRVAYVAADRHKELLAPTMANSPARPPENLLQALHYAPQETRDALDAAFQLAFPGLHVLLDATERINLSLRVAREIPEPSDDPVEAVQQFAALPLVDQEGDGVCTYLTVLLTMLLGQGRIILLDQPDAFLHPSQAHCLGKWITQNAAKLGCQVFIATHNDALLNGLLSDETDVTILRLKRTANSVVTRVIPPDASRVLTHHALFAYQEMLGCLLRDGVIMVPSHDDRIVYETVARRILKAEDVCFVNAHGESDRKQLSEILRQCGLPTCVVAQLDAFQTEARFRGLVESTTGQETPAPWLATRERLAQHIEGMFDNRGLSAGANEVESFLEQFKAGKGIGEADSKSMRSTNGTRTRWASLRREHLGALPPEVRVWVEELLDELKSKGIFISPKGGFQSWIPYDVENDDREVWLSRALQSLQRGECPADLRSFVSDLVSQLRSLAHPVQTSRARLRK